MGWRYRRNAQVIPGVRLNFTKSGVGVSIGGHAARYSIHSSGRRTVSFGTPIPGLYWTESLTNVDPLSPSKGQRRAQTSAPRQDGPRGFGGRPNPQLRGPQSLAPA